MSEQWLSSETAPILRRLLPIKQGMISHHYKCIFVAVAKTGSTSVRRILGRAIKPHLSLSEIRRLMESYWVIRGGRKDRIMEWLYLMLPAERRKERGRQQFESYFKFGFVRNPWGRVVSLYERNEAVQMRRQMSFEEFVLNTVAAPASILRLIVTSLIGLSTPMVG